MQVVHGIQVIKARLLLIHIFNLTVGQRFKNRIAAKTIGQGKRLGLNMFPKYSVTRRNKVPIYCSFPAN